MCFGIPGGMLSGFLVSERGIEANSEKIVAITNMGTIGNLKGVQRVVGYLASLSHFISHLEEHGHPLYKLLRKADRFEWTMEVQEALDSLKNVLTEAPILVPPKESESLLLYIAAITQVVRSMLVVERQEEGCVQLATP
jgi:hypothetical protein